MKKNKKKILNKFKIILFLDNYLKDYQTCIQKLVNILN